MFDEAARQGRVGPLHVREVGAGPIALFIHGFPLDSRMWSAQLGDLVDTRRCVAPDLRGFGASDVTDVDVLTMEGHADDLRAVLGALGSPQADVIGLSMGGYVALALWERHPELVRSLVLADTRARADLEAERARRETSAERLRVEGPEALRRELTEAMLAPRTGGDRRRVVRRMLEATSTSTMVAALCGVARRRDRTELLSTIDVPTLVVCGEHDATTPLRDAEAIASAIPAAELVVIPGAGHLPPVEQPEAFNRALRAFWARSTPV